ncbi:MAG: hypothetical protein HFE51_04945 [Clostridia bacterium]|nr:hypothetical protein [Clostridia bacterium]
MTFYEHLKQCSIESVADFIIATQFRENNNFQCFLQSKEYTDTKKSMVKFLNSEMDDGI